MSEPFDLDSFSGPRARRGGGGGTRKREPIRTGKAAFNGRELRMMIGIGLVLAIAMYQGTQHAAHLGAFDREAPPKADTKTGAGHDPYAESRRSRAILDAQTGEVPDLDAAALLGGITVRAGSFRLVPDGTLQVRGQRIRLADIDLPRTTGACPHEIALAGRALQRLGALLSAGPFQLGEAGGRDADGEGRKLRIATRGGRSIGAELVRDGLAHPAADQPQPWCASGIGTV